MSNREGVVKQYNLHQEDKGSFEVMQFRWGGGEGGGGRGTWVNFCWVCAAGLSEPLPHYSLFCDQL